MEYFIEFFTLANVGSVSRYEFLLSIWSCAVAVSVHTDCMGLNSLPWCKFLEPQNVRSFINSIFTEVTKIKSLDLEWFLNPMTRVFLRKTCKHTERCRKESMLQQRQRLQWWAYSPKMRRIVSNYQQLGDRRKHSSSQPLEEITLSTPDFGLLAPELREIIHFCFLCQFVIILVAALEN